MPRVAVMVADAGIDVKTLKTMQTKKIQDEAFRRSLLPSISRECYGPVGEGTACCANCGNLLWQRVNLLMRAGRALADVELAGPVLAL